MLIALALAFSAVDPQTLLERAQVLEKQNEAERARYVAREDIKTTRIAPDGSRRQTSWRTYEAMIVEKRLRFRLVARDGVTLPAAKQQLQPEGRRSSLALKQILTHHEVSLAGEDTVNGRPAWRLRTRLRPGAPSPKKLSDIALSGPFEIWIDQATGLECKLRITVEHPWANWRKGATIETFTERIDKLFVIARTLIRNPNGKSVDETDQSYTDYRRFSGDSLIKFDPL